MFEMDSTAFLLWGLLLYGKKQKAIVPLCVGVALCVSLYFIANVSILAFVEFV